MPPLGRYFDKIALLQFERLEDPLGNDHLAALSDAAYSG